MIDIDPQDDTRVESLSPRHETKRVQIGSTPFEMTYIWHIISQEEETEILELLRENLDLFAWKPSDIRGIDPSFMCHYPALNPNIKLVS